MPVSCAVHHFSSTPKHNLFHPQVKFRRYPTLGGWRRGASAQIFLLELSAVCDEKLRELFLCRTTQVLAHCPVAELSKRPLISDRRRRSKAAATAECPNTYFALPKYKSLDIPGRRTADKGGAQSWSCSMLSMAP